MQDSFLRLYYVRRIPLTESIYNLFLSFVVVHCLHVIRKLIFSLTGDSRLRHLKPNKIVFSSIRKTNKQDEKMATSESFTKMMLLITLSNTRRVDSPLSNFLFSLYEFTTK